MENYVFWNDPAGSLWSSLSSLLIFGIALAAFGIWYTKSLRRTATDAAIAEIEREAEAIESEPDDVVLASSDGAVEHLVDATVDSEGDVEVEEKAIVLDSSVANKLTTEEIADAEIEVEKQEEKLAEGIQKEVDELTEEKKHTVPNIRPLINGTFAGVVAAAIGILVIGIPASVLSYMQSVDSLTKYLDESYSISLNSEDVGTLYNTIKDGDSILINYQGQPVSVSLKQVSGSNGGYLLVGDLSTSPVPQ